MDDPLVQLSNQELTSIASALKSERLSPPFRSQGLQRFVDATVAGSVASGLQGLTDQGFTPSMISSVISMLLSQRATTASSQAVIELVTSGPWYGSSQNCEYRLHNSDSVDDESKLYGSCCFRKDRPPVRQFKFIACLGSGLEYSAFRD